MTKDEAVKIIEGMDFSCFSPKEQCAIIMAISALELSPEIKNPGLDNVTYKEGSEEKQDLFKAFVLFLAEQNYLRDASVCDAIRILEGKIEDAGGSAYFGVAREHWDSIDVIRPYFHSKYRFRAEYYDGFQAEFVVCEWNDDFEKLEALLEETSKGLYDEYLKYLEEQEKEY